MNTTPENIHPKGRIWRIILGIWLITSLACTLPGLGGKTPTPAVPTQAPTPKALPNLPPALVETNPLPASEIGLLAPLTLYFNQPMMRDTVQAALSLSPAVEGIFDWLDDATLRFTPQTELPAGSEITLTVAKSAKAQNGVALVQDQQVVFNTPSNLNITQRIPTPGDAEINPASAIVVAFNRPVVALKAEDPGSGPAAFTLEPAVEGQGTWLNTSTYVFHAAKGLGGGLTYTVHVDPTLQSVEGLGLDAGQTLDWTFTTSAPMVIGFNPAADSRVLLDQEFSIEFNQPMDRGSIESNLILQSVNGETYPVKIEWQNNDTKVVFKPVNLLPRNTSLLMSLDQQAAAISGTPLGTTFSTGYQTVPPFAVDYTSPAGEGPVPYYDGYAYLDIKFTAPVADKPLKNLVSVSPEVQGFNAYRGYDGWDIGINGYFAPDSRYTLTLSPDLEDIYGQKLGVNYTWSFRISPAQPSFNIPLVQNGGYSVFLEPNQPVLTAQATNVTYVDISGGTLPLDLFMAQSASYGDALTQLEVENERSWTQRLNLDPNKSTYLNVPLTPDGGGLSTGVYLFKLRVPELDNNYNRYVIPVLTTISNVNITLKATSREAFVWVVDLRTQQPLANEEVGIYNGLGGLLGTVTTDANGKASLTYPDGPLADYEDVVAVTGQPGLVDFGMSRRSWSSGLNGWDFGISTYEQPTQDMSYLYTDRPIYRPGQTVFFRAVLRQVSGWQYSAYQGESVTVKLIGTYDATLDASPELGSQTLTVSRYGTVSGEFSLPEDAQPGYYQLKIAELTYSADISFKVANYRKPEFEFSVNFPADEMQAGQNIQANVDATYYFGAPAGNLPVNWTLYAASEWFDLPGGYQVGKIDNSWLRMGWMYDGFGSLYGQAILSGNGQTDASGRLILNFNWADISERFDPEVFSKLTLEVSGMDESNFAVVSRNSMLLHPAAAYIGIRPEAWGIQAGSEAGYVIQTVDWLKKPLGNLGLTATFNTVEWVKSDSPSPFGYTTYTPQYTPVASTDFQTDGQGKARISFTPSDPGTYMLEVRGGSAVTQIYAWVGGPGASEWPNLPYQHLNLQADASSYEPGQTARIFIPNPYPQGALALITLEQDSVKRAEVLQMTGSSYLYQLPITDAEAPNVYVSVILISRLDDGRADFRMGILDLDVTPTAHLLNLSLTANPPQAGPGENVTFTLRATDQSGAPVQGEFSLSVVDKAVLALADPNSLSIQKEFYSPKALGVFTGLSLAQYGRRIVPTPAGGRGGGGGGDMLAEKGFTRSNFKDTAYWSGVLETSPDGTAEVTLALPDNLTTWVATARGLTADLRVGETTTEVVASKDLLVRPSTPRFLVAGDHLELAAVVQNNTQAPLSADVSIQVVGFTLDDPATMVQKVDLPAGGRQRVAWRGTVQVVESVDVLFRAVNDTYQDAVRPERNPIPVLRFSSPQTFGTSGMLTSAGELTEVVSLPRSYTPTGGELDVEMAPSMAAMILHGLDALEAYPYEYPEGVLSRMLPNLETYRTLSEMGINAPDLKTRLEAAIADGMTKLQTLQNPNGGWGWYNRGQSDAYLSAYVLYGLSRAGAAGVSVDGGMLSSAKAYVNSTFSIPSISDEDWKIDRAVFIAFALTESGMEVSLDNLYDLRDRMNPWSKAMLAMSLQTLDSGDSRVQTLSSDLEGQAVRSATGAFWQDTNESYYNLSTPNFNTAVVLTLLARVNPASPLVGDAVRYLAYNRNVRGGWLSSYETSWVILSLTEVMRATGELQAVYDFSAAVNGTPVASGKAGGLQNMTIVSARVALQDLVPDYPNAVTFSRTGDAGRLYYRTYLQVFRPVEGAEAVNRGISVERKYYVNWADCQKEGCTPVQSYSLSTEDKPVVVRLSVVVPNDLSQVVVVDSFPAGAEIIDRSLKITQKGEPTPSTSSYDPYDPLGGGWGWWWFNAPKVYDDHIQWIAESLPAGTYTLTYELMPAHAGEFQVIPAHAYLAFFPEVEGLSAGEIFTIEP